MKFKISYFENVFFQVSKILFKNSQLIQKSLGKYIYFKKSEIFAAKKCFIKIYFADIISFIKDYQF